MTRSRPLMILLTILAMVSTGCGLIGGNDNLEVIAIFDDVVDLVPAASVRAGDVTIGSITDIELTDDNRARVTMSVIPDTGLPTDTEAVLNKTSLLGERFVDLRPVGDSGQLEDGQEITETRELNDLEDLVLSGSDLLAFVASDQLGAAIETGAVAFGGRGGLIGQFVTSVNAFVGDYDEGQQDILRLIDSLDDLTAGLAPAAEANAEGITVLRQVSEALQREDDRLLDALDDLTRLSVVGTRIARDQQVETDNAVRRLRKVLQQVNRIDGSLQGLLTFGPRHNLHVPNGSVDDFAQVWLDFIVCGFNDEPDDPSRTCDPPNPGTKAPPPPFSPVSDECNQSHTNCPKPQRGQDEVRE